jgi:molybdate transport system ATP-binding protein
MIDIRISRRLPGFVLDAAFASDSGITALFGRSGSGKTTVVNAIAGLVRPDDGVISVNGVCLFDSARGINVPVPQRRVGYVFQDGRLFPHLTVRANLRYGYELAARHERPIEFDKVVALLGLEALLERRPANLSGGEKQRVAIGRALLASPRLLLMDEPLAALDHARKSEVLHYIARLHREISVPIVYVSHSVEEVVQLAETVVLMADGRVVASGPVAQVMGRADLRARGAGFEGGTVIEARVSARDDAYDLATLDFDGGELKVPGVTAAVGEALRVRIRARDIAIALTAPADISVLNILHGEVVEVQGGGDARAVVRVRVGATVLTSRITRYSAERLKLAAGTPVCVLIKAISLN